MLTEVGLCVDACKRDWEFVRLDMKLGLAEITGNTAANIITNMRFSKETPKFQVEDAEAQ